VEHGTYRVPIAGEWTLEDLYVFPRTYEQCYFMYLALLPDAWDSDEDRIAHAYEAFPWQGGYSAVGFYNQLKWAVAPKRRPHIKQIKYASPGFIELGLIVAVATAVAGVVRSATSTARDISNAYTDIYRDLQERKLLKIKTENELRRLTAVERRVIEAHVQTLSRILNVDSSALTAKTGASYKSLKILLSLFRRIRRLAEFQKRGKIKL
jgi:hypothetical protein